MNEVILRLTYPEQNRFEWMLRARRGEGDRDILESVIKIGKRLLCIDGFRAHSIPLPEWNEPVAEMKSERGVFKPLSQPSTVMVVEKIEEDIPRSLSNIAPAPEDQMIVFQISPRYLTEALCTGQMTATIRVFRNNTTGEPDLVTVEGTDGEVAYIKPMSLKEVNSTVPRLTEPGC